jgi:hypothetical protein
MPKQGWEGITELLGDLWRELTPIVRTCVFTGMGLGLLATISWLVFGPSIEMIFIPLSIRALGVLVFILCIPAVIGGVVGCGVGVLIELIFGKGEPTSGKYKSKRRR